MKRALILGFVLGCSSPTASPSVALHTLPSIVSDAGTGNDVATPPLDDAGEPLPSDDASAVTTADAAPVVASDAGRDAASPLADSGEADSAPEPDAADAAPWCDLAGAGQDVCGSYGFTSYVMSYCAGSCPVGQHQIATSAFSDGGPAIWCCAAP